jgi:hypothetical protein
VEKLKNKWSFFIALIISAILLLAALYYIKGILPTYAKGFTAEIISVLALVISVGSILYKNLFPTKLLRDYHVSPQDLVALYGRHGHICIKVHLENLGEVNINIQFQWLDFRNERFTYTVTRDSRGQDIDSSIELPPGTQKDVYITFENDRNKSRFFKEYIEAYNKKESRLIESFRHEQARLTWSDVTPEMQQLTIPFGAWVIELINRNINS